jgi:hypothetical protein
MIKPQAGGTLVGRPRHTWGIAPGLVYPRSWKSVVSVVTRLQAEWSRVWFASGVRGLSILQNIKANSGPHPASCSVGSRGSSVVRARAGSWPLCLVPKLRLSGTVPVLSVWPHGVWWSGMTVRGYNFCSSYMKKLIPWIHSEVNLFWWNSSFALIINER